MNGNMAEGMCVNTLNTSALFELRVFYLHEITTSPIKLVCDIGKKLWWNMAQEAYFSSRRNAL